MRKKSSKISTIVLLVILLVGFSVMLYPIISDWWNSHVQSRAIETYDKKVSEMSGEDFEEIFQKARSITNFSADYPLLSTIMMKFQAMRIYLILPNGNNGICNHSCNQREPSDISRNQCRGA